MRCVLALMLVAGCGRIDFDTTRGAFDSGTGDADSIDAPLAFTVYVISGDGIGQTELMTLDLASGLLTHVAFIPAALGTIGGLAYWDANTLYGAANNSFIQITLSPFSAAMLTSMPGTWSALERDGTNLIGVDQDGDAWGKFAPGGAAGPFLTQALGIDAIGGDIATSAGVWYWYSNTGTQLYMLNASALLTGSSVAGPVIPVGSPATGAPFISGMTADLAGNLYVSSADTDAIYPISKTTGQLGAPIALVTGTGAYDLLSGDMTRTP